MCFKVLPFTLPYNAILQVFSTWLSYLPIKDDPNEAKVVHEQLCSMVEW
jgi:hypothetical protein